MQQNRLGRCCGVANSSSPDNQPNHGTAWGAGEAPNGHKPDVRLERGSLLGEGEAAMACGGGK